MTGECLDCVSRAQSEAAVSSPRPHHFANERGEIPSTFPLHISATSPPTYPPGTVWMPATMPRRRVASGVSVRTEHGGRKGGQTRVLLTMRDDRSDFANHWECPGGKVEPGETELEALRREYREELGVHSIRIYPEPLGTVDFDPPIVPKPTTITFYRVDISPDDPPSALQSRCLAYFEPEALDSLPLTPANRALIDIVKAECR